MTRKPSKSTYGSSGDTARAIEAVRTMATPVKAPELAHAQRDLADRIQPALKLSELNKTSEVMKAISAQQRMAEQVRASLQLPHLETLTKQATGLTSARDLARAAVVIPPSIEHRSALLDRPAAVLGDNASTITITSAHDLGRLIRAERERRKLSQQAFADLVGVGRRFISELENGKATLEFGKVLQVTSAGGIDVLARRRR